MCRNHQLINGTGKSDIKFVFKKANFKSSLMSYFISKFNK